MPNETSTLNAFVFHGTGGNPEGNWFPWLKERLETSGIKTVVPALPTPENQSVENWLDAVSRYLPDMGENTHLIGHSSGANFILHLLERLRTPVKYAVFVGTIMQPTGLEDIDSLNETFINHTFDWTKLRRSAARFKIFHSDNDPYTPLPHAERLSEGLGVPIHLIPGKGHLNAEWGCLSFDLLADDILKPAEQKPRAFGASKL
ncbi:MAG TPA: alpha/beta hydrolase [Alphaproteobacteria bacterium]|nr:alpha/beta hydrolase [Alphaproteobacteria bacterium]